MITELTDILEASPQAIETALDISAIPFGEAIIEAIETRRTISIRYDRDRLPRLFAPYLLRLAKNGNYNIVGMQIENQNCLDGENERRTFIVSKIKSLELTKELFVPVDTFKPDEPSHATGIVACVLPWNSPCDNDILNPSV